MVQIIIPPFRFRKIEYDTSLWPISRTQKEMTRLSCCMTSTRFSIRLLVLQIATQISGQGSLYRGQRSMRFTCEKKQKEGTKKLNLQGL